MRCRVGLARALFPRSLYAWRPGKFSFLQTGNPILNPRDSYYYTVRSDDVKVLKSRWNFVKAKTTTPGNNIYTLLRTFIAFTSFISSKFQTLFFPYKLSYYTPFCSDALVSPPNLYPPWQKHMLLALAYIVDSLWKQGIWFSRENVQFGKS